MKEKLEKPKFDWGWITSIFIIALIFGSLVIGRDKVPEDPKEKHAKECKHWLNSPQGAGNYQECLNRKAKEYQHRLDKENLEGQDKL